MMIVSGLNSLIVPALFVVDVSRTTV